MFAEFSLHFRGLDHAEGFSNRTQDGRYVVFLDFDNFKLSWLLDEVARLMAWFDLSHFFIFQSGKKGYHAVCLDIVSYSTYKEILNSCSVDPSFRTVPINASYKSWILRTGAKKNRNPPKFLRFVTPEDDRTEVHDNFTECSKAHYDYMVRSALITRAQQAIIHKYLEPLLDESSKLYMTAYETGSTQLI